MTDLLFAVKKIEAQLKHLPGKHDQATHAGARGGAKPSPAMSGASGYSDVESGLRKVLKGRPRNAVPGVASEYRAKGNKMVEVGKYFESKGVKLQHVTGDNRYNYGDPKGLSAWVSYNKTTDRATVELKDEAAMRKRYTME